MGDDKLGQDGCPGRGGGTSLAHFLDVGERDETEARGTPSPAAREGRFAPLARSKAGAADARLMKHNFFPPRLKTVAGATSVHPSLPSTRHRTGQMRHFVPPAAPRASRPGRRAKNAVGAPPSPPPHLQLGQGLLDFDVVLPQQKAVRLDARRVVLHVDGDGAAGLGAAADVVELEAHEGLHQGWGG